MSKAPNPHVMNTTTAGPIGLTAFGVTTILLNFLNAELIEKPSITLIICYGMFHGGMIQILAGMWEVYRGSSHQNQGFQLLIFRSIFNLLPTDHLWRRSLMTAAT
mmetsp:Transcript_24192/g.55122  ORF Transcript_24192/g.55122 Transcript_24192/m.55122 type:complete len:105 (+) Transcript_24192:69-383(+)